MKRVLTIGLTCVFLVYGIVLLSSFNLLGTNRFLPFKNTIKSIRIFAGIGALFTREVTLENYYTTYRFYENGKWGNWLHFEEKTFKAYVDHYSIAELKHSRLDIHLSQKLYFSGYKPKPSNFYQSKAYQVFINHLLTIHHPDQKPDSLELTYQKHDYKQASQVLLTFKCKP